MQNIVIVLLENFLSSFTNLSINTTQMNDLEFRQQVLDPKSASFCAAKWYNATIWLGSGQTTSCHHPPAHAIDRAAIETNPSAIHNTHEKKMDRLMMQNGERPRGCEYCWKIEDMGRDAISDRVYKSKIYPLEALNEAYRTPPAEDVNLRTLEIAFDRTCQFACSYCNPAFSSTWVRDIQRNGPYDALVSDGRNHFTHTHDSAQLYRFGETNPYVEAFFRWWETDLHKTLQELRITGGEPLMSGDTWKLIDWFKNNKGKSTTRLAINSNLGAEVDLDRLLSSIEGQEVDIYTSMEATKAQAEYIRDGLDYNTWIVNAQKVLDSDDVRALHCMATINALCLDTLPELLNTVGHLKQLYGKQRVSFTLNILRFPSFQSALVLPDAIRTAYKDQLQLWLDSNQDNPLLHEHEINHMQRLIDYLDVVKTPHSDTFEMPKLHNDFKQFYTQYDQRRGKDFVATFPALADWYQSL
jgi:organic radical activating enzyme